MRAARTGSILVTPDHAEYDLILQTLHDNVQRPYTDGSRAGFVDLGGGLREFIIANENTGAISHWAAIDRNAAPKTIVYNSLTGGPDSPAFNILEPSGALWVMQTPESCRID